MTGPEHYQAAEKCVEDVQNMADADAIELVLMEAQVHATLALAAATAGKYLTEDHNVGWMQSVEAQT